MATKSCTLISGCEKKFSWNIKITVRENESFKTRGEIAIYNNKIRSEKYNSKEYYRLHKKEILECSSNYYQTHKKQKKERNKRYIKTPKGKEVRKKVDAKRRELDFIPLNEWFDGSHGHHLNKKYAVYIPAELHSSVYHNIWTGQGMHEINMLALDYLLNDNLMGYNL